MPYLLRPTFYVQHPTSYTLRLTFCFLGPLSWVLCPKSYDICLIFMVLAVLESLDKNPVVPGSESWKCGHNPESRIQNSDSGFLKYSTQMKLVKCGKIEQQQDKTC